MPVIWDESYLLGKLEEAERDAVGKVDYLFYRTTISVTQGWSTVTLPSYVRKIARITWKGYKIWPVSWREMRDLNPSVAVVSDEERYETTQGKPLYYCLHPNNYRKIQFFPAPNESIAADPLGTADIMGTAIPNYVIVSCYRAPSTSNPSLQLPPYIARRTKKAYALREAFLIEGKGQNIKASDYYSQKYDWEIENFKKINNGVFVARRPQLSDKLGGSGAGGRPARPVLPVNFARRGF